jgi:hypothetical protein
MSVTILFKTEKTFYVRWNCGENSHNTWEYKNFINNDYNLIEDITNYILISDYDKIINGKDFSPKSGEKCALCSGNGYIIDNKSTAGRTPCPACNGYIRTTTVTNL